MSQEKDIQLVLHLMGMNGPLFVHAEPGTQNEMAEWLLKIIEKNGLAVFRTPDGVVQTVVRGPAILGFGFEPVQFDPEIADLHKRRLKAEVEHMERALKPREGEEWKDGY
ncbi:MAG: hypothetical protein ACW99J_17865 [Candidatus Thorarchaeota archaeon]|jgi:hypothetical protein